MYIQNNRKPLNLGKEHAIRFIYRGCGNSPLLSFIFFSLLSPLARHYRERRYYRSFDSISSSVQEPMRNQSRASSNTRLSLLESILLQVNAFLHSLDARRTLLVRSANPPRTYVYIYVSARVDQPR